ncbi:MAG: hypothetical protein J7480_04030, partial [Microbacteriaceae bacterium]|nr:hypothetical protein [Microbacteriaceae bacterium]
YDAPTGTSGTLAATDEWNLSADFPAIGENAGLEGITFVPDEWLVANGYFDQTRSHAYDPGDYPLHGEGLFVIAVE